MMRDTFREVFEVSYGWDNTGVILLHIMVFISALCKLLGINSYTWMEVLYPLCAYFLFVIFIAIIIVIYRLFRKWVSR